MEFERAEHDLTLRSFRSNDPNSCRPFDCGREATNHALAVSKHRHAFRVSLRSGALCMAFHEFAHDIDRMRCRMAGYSYSTPSDNGCDVLFAGVGDAILTRGKHIGWPLLSAAGILALLGS